MPLLRPIRPYTTRWAHAVLSAFTGGYLLSPQIAGSIDTGRWPLWLLAVISAGLICARKASLQCSDVPNQSGAFRRHDALFLAAGICLVTASAIFDTDKLRALAGAIWLGGALTACCIRPPKVRHRHKHGYSLAYDQGYKRWYYDGVVVAVFMLAVPLPAGFSADIAASLAAVQAATIAALAPVLDGSLYTRGTDIIVNGAVFTINQDCSGSRLIAPSLMGGITAACLAPNRPRIAAALLLSLPAALILNMLRLVLVILAAKSGKTVMIDSVHDGLGVLLMSAAWYLPVAVGLGVMAPAAPAAHINHVVAAQDTLFSGTQFTTIITIVAKNATVTTAIILGGVLAAFADPTGGPRPAHRAELTATLPHYVSGWASTPASIAAREAQLLAADGLERRSYTHIKSDQQRLVTLILHRSHDTARQHDSARCFRAMGWAVSVDAGPVIATRRHAPNWSHLTVSSGPRRQNVSEVTAASPQGHYIRLQIVGPLSDDFGDQRRFGTALIDRAMLGGSKPAGYAQVQYGDGQ